MSSAMPHAELPVSKLEEARRYLGSWLGRIRDATTTTGREMAVEAICSGLQAMPVPVLNTALAKMARHALSDTPGNPAADPQEILELLATMQRSNDEFERGLQTLGADLAELRDDVAAIHATLTEPVLTLTNPKVESRWPVAENRISALLTNNGGGSVQVDEIYLEIEDWEADTAIDYSIPLAPLIVLDLRAELSSGRAEYSLFELNEVPPRTFEERGAGAERINIDLSAAMGLLASCLPPRLVRSQSNNRKVWPLQGFLRWSQPGSNRRPPACKAGALPTELWPLRGTSLTPGGGRSGGAAATADAWRRSGAGGELEAQGPEIADSAA
jgi:hypothetical protein